MAHTFKSEIQGLRGVAILLVVLYHAGVPYVSAGYIGVDVFFVISGFLITGLLLREQETSGRIDLGEFFARRMRRLLPAAILLIAFVVVTSHVVYPPLERQPIHSAARAAAVYLANLWFAGRAIDYLAGDASSNPLLHMWSLAVEEQFYIVWPILIAAVVRFGSASTLRQRLLAVVGSVTLVSFLYCLWMTWQSQPWAFFGTPFRAWEFGLGALVAIAGARLQALPQSGMRALGFAGMALVIGGALLIPRHGLFPGFLALAPSVGTAMVLSSLLGSAPSLLGWLLRAWPLVRLGDISYSLYLWHWPLLVFAAVIWPQFDSLVVCLTVLVALGAAVLSYHAVENPIRFHRRLVLSKRLSLGWLSGASIALAIGTSVLVQAERSDGATTPDRFAVAQRDIPRVYRDGCHGNFDATDLPPCVYGHREGSRSVVLFGDSHAAQWFPALERLALDHEWRLMSLTKSSCPAFDVLVTSTAKRREYTECEQWRSRMVRRIIDARPGIVFIGNSSRHYASPVEWEAGMRRTIKRFTDAGIAIAILRDTPWPGFDTTQCLARLHWRGGDSTEPCSFGRSRAMTDGLQTYEAELRGIAEFHAVHLMDFTLTICPHDDCRAERDGVLLYSDAHHLTTHFVERLVPSLVTDLRRWSESNSIISTYLRD